MARGRALISLALDVGYEAAFIFTAAFGAGPVIKNGLTQHSLAVIAAVSPRASLDRSPFLSRRHRRSLLRALPPRFDIAGQDRVPGIKDHG
jgi:hypothetical protein